jgi:DNA-binding NarL/FixJ family response regulator
MRTRFLIVDDSEPVRKGLRTILQANPEWEVVGEAGDGESAIEIFKTTRPNVVIVDFRLPDMNGLDVARRLLDVAPAVPIVMFTQHASPDLERLAKQAGIRSIVSKTDAFPMVGIIEALLGPDGPSPSVKAVNAEAAHAGKKDRGDPASGSGTKRDSASLTSSHEKCGSDGSSESSKGKR